LNYERLAYGEEEPSALMLCPLRGHLGVDGDVDGDVDIMWMMIVEAVVKGNTALLQVGG
jgi:hypothetical protein